MATPVWPPQLEQYVNQDTFGYAFGDTTIRSENDTGLQKVRPRFTHGIDTMTASVNMHRDDYPVLFNFYKTFLSGGSRSFEFPHPITRETILVRFTAPPSLSPLGGLYYSVTLAFEVLP